MKRGVMGQDMEKRSKMVGFMTTPEVKAALAAIAEREDRSISYIINRILMQHLELCDNPNENEE